MRKASKLVRSTIAAFCAVMLAVSCLPVSAETGIVSAQDPTGSAVVLDYDPEDAGRFRSTMPVGTATALPDTLVHNSRYDADCYTLCDGIDVSKWQNDIDWEKVAASGVEFAFIRIGYRGYGKAGILSRDTYFEKNLAGAKAAGIKVGVYFFTQAISSQEAIDEANYTLGLLNGRELDFPVYIDIEAVDGATGRLDAAGLTKAQLTAQLAAFCSTIEDGGYQAGIYANKSWLTNRMYADQLSANYHIWLANYTTQTTYSGDYECWQFSSTGAISGISGNVDRNVFYLRDCEYVSDSFTIEIGDAPMRPAMYGNGPLAFFSSDPDICTVDATGRVSGVSKGSAEVTVSSPSGKTDTITVNVEYPASVMLSYSTVLLSGIGETEYIFTELADPDLQLTSSDPSVVSVTNDGVVKAVGVGTAQVTAKTNRGSTAVCSIIVTETMPQRGDCNCDGSIDALDAAEILHFSASLGSGEVAEQLTPAHASLYDYNDDGAVDSLDAAEVLIYSAASGAGK